MADRQHSWTGILILIFAILTLLGALFLTFAYAKVLGTSEYKNGNQKMINAKNALLWGFILGYLAAGIGITLSILYFGHVVWGIHSEIPHLILFILLFLLIIGAIIAASIALSNLHSADINDSAGAPSWIWAAIISLGIGIIFLIISGAWRAYHRTSGKSSLIEPQAEVTVTSPSTVTHVATGYQAMIPSAPLTQAPEVAFPYGSSV